MSRRGWAIVGAVVVAATIWGVAVGAIAQAVYGWLG